MELFISLIFSSIGAGYFLYGKKAVEVSFMLAGGILCIYPYMVTGAMSMVIIGLVLMAAPFIAQRLGW